MESSGGKQTEVHIRPDINDSSLLQQVETLNFQWEVLVRAKENTSCLTQGVFLLTAFSAYPSFKAFPLPASRTPAHPEPQRAVPSVVPTQQFEQGSALAKKHPGKTNKLINI